MPNETNLWEISRNGIDSINKLQKDLQNSIDQMNQAFTSLNNKFITSVDGLGIYSDSINATLKTMKAVNAESTQALGYLMQRLNQYEVRIRMELEKQGEL